MGLLGGDEFTTGLRAKKRRVAISTQRNDVLPSADNKPEGLIRYEGDDEQLVKTLDSIRRNLQVVQGVKGKSPDAGVTFRTLEQELAPYALALPKSEPWTPILSDAVTAGVVATGTFTGWYVSSGDLITCHLSCAAIDTTGMTGANELFIQGMPRASKLGFNNIGQCLVENVAFTAPLAFYNVGGTNTGQVAKMATGAALTYMLVSDLTTTTANLSITLQYRV